MLRTQCTSCDRRLKISDDSLAGENRQLSRLAGEWFRFLREPMKSPDTLPIEPTPPQRPLRLDRGESVDSEQITKDASDAFAIPPVLSEPQSRGFADPVERTTALNEELASVRSGNVVSNGSNVDSSSDESISANTARFESTQTARRRRIAAIFTGSALAMIVGVAAAGVMMSRSGASVVADTTDPDSTSPKLDDTDSANTNTENSVSATESTGENECRD